MGIHCSSDLRNKRITEGRTVFLLFNFLTKNRTKLTMKVFMIAALCLAAAVSAEPEADAYYGYGLYGHQQAWSGAYGPGFSATCYGCRPYGLHHLGKRDAEADAEPLYGYGFPGYGYFPYGGYGYHGYGGNYVHRSPQGLRGKRSAEPHGLFPYAYGYPYGFYGHPLAAIPTPAGPTGVAGHPTGTSFVARSPQGLRGKRSAEPFYGYGYGHPYAFYAHPRAVFGPGVAGHAGGGTSYVARSPQGLGK